MGGEGKSSAKQALAATARAINSASSLKAHSGLGMLSSIGQFLRPASPPAPNIVSGRATV
jgi:hypothetical protein